MQFQGRALYNLMRINWLEDPKIQVKKWQVDDYRAYLATQIYKELEKLGIFLTQESFLMYASGCDSPEELIDCLWLHEEDIEGHDHVYLLLFELWRRLLPEKSSLSIFCDELDYRVYLYDRNLLPEEGLLEDAIADLEDILDQNVDRGEKPKDVFQTIGRFCAHDLEKFLYDYISDHIESKKDLYASELLDEFYDYISNTKWFDFLRIRLFINSDPYDANANLRRLLEQSEEDPNLEFLLEITSFLVHCGDPALFLKSVKQAYELIRDEEDFQALIKLVSEYFCCLDKDQQYKTLQTFLDKRSKNRLDTPLDPSDKDLWTFSKLLENAERGKI
jgi:hypothetical protein